MPDELTGVIDSTPESSLEAGQEGLVEDQPQINDSAQNQTEALRVMREEISKLKHEADFFKQQAQFYQQQQPRETKPEYEPDDIITYADMNKIVDSRLKEMESRATASRQAQQEQAARASHADWEEVVTKVRGKVSDRQWDIMLAADNPFEEVYQFGKMTLPEYARAQATQGMTQQIQKNLSTPGTLTNVTGQQQGISQYSDLANAPRDKFLEAMERHMNS